MNSINYPINIDTLKPILNPFKYKYIKKENKNNNYFPYIVNNIGENINSNNLFYNSYYYTLHGNYLNKLKQNYKNKNYSNNINEYMHSLTDYINTKKINNNRSVDLLDIISFLENERNNFYKGKPIILIIYACSLKENYEYKQNEILSSKFNRDLFYNYNNKILVNQNRYIDKTFIRSIVTIFNIIDTNLSSLNNIDKINNYTLILINKTIRENNNLNNQTLHLFNLYNNLIYNSNIYMYDSYNKYNHKKLDDLIIPIINILYFNSPINSGIDDDFIINFNKKYKIKLLFIKKLFENIFKYYLLLFLKNNIKYKYLLNNYIDKYQDNFNNFSYFIDIHSKIYEKTYNENYSNNFHNLFKNDNSNQLLESKTNNNSNQLLESKTNNNF